MTLLVHAESLRGKSFTNILCQVKLYMTNSYAVIFHVGRVLFYFQFRCFFAVNSVSILNLEFDTGKPLEVKLISQFAIYINDSMRLMPRYLDIKVTLLLLIYRISCPSPEKVFDSSLASLLTPGFFRHCSTWQMLLITFERFLKILIC